MPDISLLTQADFILNACGRPEVPQKDLAIVPLYHGFPVQVVFAQNAATPTQVVTTEITGDTDFYIQSLQISSQSSPATAISLQVLLPNGKFLINNLQDALQIAGYGSYRYLFSKELRCPPKSKIQVTFQVTDTTNVQPLVMLFEGCYCYYIKAGTQQICPSDEAMALAPRYFGDPNQNIFAPCWRQGVGPATPPGFIDEEFTYFNTAAPTVQDVTATNLAATQQIGMEAGSEFHVRRILIEITADNTVTAATLLTKIRNGSGYALFDDYFDLSKYVASNPMPSDWVIDPADSVYIDGQIVDQAGTGNFSWTVYLEGFKRRAA